MLETKDSQKTRLSKAMNALKKGEISGMDTIFDLALEGYPIAEYMLGDYLEFEMENYPEALKWYSQAANHGYAIGQKCFADMLMAGKGTECDRNEAFTWYSRAADQGIAEAQFVLGEFYRLGTDVERDIKKAEYWYTQAKENGLKLAEYRLNKLNSDNKKETSPESDFSETDKEILILPTDVTQSANEGMDYLFGGKGVRKDYKKALSLLLYAAQKGYYSAQFALALMYGQGRGTEKDLNQSFYWLSEAAKGHMGIAQHELAKFYCNGMVCEKNFEKAAYLFGKAADNNIPEAMFYYGLMLGQGKGITADKKRGFEYIKMAARNGYKQAKIVLKQLEKNIRCTDLN